MGSGEEKERVSARERSERKIAHSFVRAERVGVAGERPNNLNLLRERE